MELILKFKRVSDRKQGQCNACTYITIKSDVAVNRQTISLDGKVQRKQKQESNIKKKGVNRLTYGPGVYLESTSSKIDRNNSGVAHNITASQHGEGLEGLVALLQE